MSMLLLISLGDERPDEQCVFIRQDQHTAGAEGILQHIDRSLLLSAQQSFKIIRAIAGLKGFREDGLRKKRTKGKLAA